MIADSFSDRVQNRLCWIARIGSVLSTGLLFLFVFGGNEQSPTLSAESIGLLFFPLGIVIGMVIGWRSPRLGGAMTAASLLAFYVWHWLSAGRFPGGPWFLFFATPGLLFLVASLLRRKTLSESA